MKIQMKNCIVANGTAALLFCASGEILAAPAIGLTKPNIDSFVAGTTAQITVTSQIPDSTVIAGSVFLQRENDDGSLATIGILHDDGLNGDAALGDRIFTLKFTISQPNPTELRYRVSAGFRGILRRAISEPFSIHVKSAATAEQTLAQLAAELRDGNIEGALKHFSPAPQNRQTFENLSIQQRDALATAFGSARLSKTTATSRIYSVDWKDDNGNPVSLKVGMAQAPTGEWLIMFW
ncbi:hypothetical protein ACHMW6_28905 [Pseudoduganella sp. UC29_106]|uniref:hypothetical protein n=1 Tax=Pseudoduganella sp. UC29_106 TaxID=3374553 RepID=UPI003756EDD9